MAIGDVNFAWPGDKQAALSLTFDDARLSQIDVGVPVLNEHEVKGTFYVLPTAVDERLAAWSAAVEVGHEMGNHSMTHPCSGNFNWSRHNALEELTLEHVEADILSANEGIQRRLGVMPTTFAYPCGQRTVGRGNNVQSYVPLIASLFSTGRTWLDESANEPSYCDLAQVTGIKMDGADPETLVGLVDDAIANGSWLVLCAHEVASASEGRSFHRAGSIEAEHMAALCSYARAKADVLWTDTVSTIASHIGQTQRDRTDTSGLDMAQVS